MKINEAITVEAMKSKPKKQEIDQELMDAGYLCPDLSIHSFKLLEWEGDIRNMKCTKCGHVTPAMAKVPALQENTAEPLARKDDVCGVMILTPHYDNGHNGGMWCAEKVPCPYHKPDEKVVPVPNQQSGQTDSKE